MLLFSLGFFVIGSALAGASQNLNMLIAARGEVSLAFDILMLIPQVAIQGFGLAGVCPSLRLYTPTSYLYLSEEKFRE